QNASLPNVSKRKVRRPCSIISCTFWETTLSNDARLTGGAPVVFFCLAAEPTAAARAEALMGARTQRIKTSARTPYTAKDEEALTLVAIIPPFRRFYLDS